ncbi:mannose-6-phosphate isomerase, class I [Thermoactinomyces sp. CICC 23799]|jgi:mannose-6-phosphate isomerase|uniref:mannose-6-phosphate isomerase, class I n=1 Tax=Thermoactinomyces sp. CICC 23799 TaxID=2767429 RepID=UPI0018DEA049|nr:mannose-6-phosphate isomerase, class I [Thermoactinomyces sp. CICC 23799]MBH8602458.1 mannose-6-phosphate isomerase, class I [Thermoactinomyces sp. CICC 23799]
MSLEPLFLKPVFQERLWGGRRLQEQFHYPVPFEKTGECWAISAHPHGRCLVKNGPYQGKNLQELWENHQELFGDRKEKTFPLLTKLIDASSDLSVQVHPDETYARVHEDEEHGKTECWYILDCEPGAEIILGHQAKSKDELQTMIRENRWEDLLQRIPVKPGDFFYIPSGTVHALGAGILVLETQQSSDVTYRLYDYDRVDPNGQKRELHLDKALDVIRVPHRPEPVVPQIIQQKNAVFTTFLKCPWFTVEKWEIDGTVRIPTIENFLLVSVIGGRGQIRINRQTASFQKGDHFILPFLTGEFQLSGKFTLMVSQPPSA